MRLLVIVLLMAGGPLAAQVFPATDYPQGYFRNPLLFPMSLSGNFGELRPNHYHMGLDLKTKAVENQLVHAAADGYVARIKIEPAGFGRAIYINHPNGFTTVYAHLNDFNPALERWVKQQQYQQQSWKVELQLTPDLFPVKKGDLIAYSGNTGGSQAPHLHFEVRRTADDVNLNPLLFGFPLPDQVPPRLLRMSIYDRNRGIYEQSPRIFPVKATGGNAHTTTPSLITVSSPRISFGIGAFDTHTGSSNLNGIFESVLYDNDRPVTGFRMDAISYNDTRYLNAHIDYRTRAGGGPWLQQLFSLPGYVNSIYGGNQDGIVDLDDGAVHTIRIEVKDANNNTSVLSFKVQYKAPATAVAPPARGAGKQFYPLMLDGYESPDCEFFIGERCLYDSVFIRYSQSATASPSVVSAVHAIGASHIPLQEAYLVRIRPGRALSEEERQRTVMQWYVGAKKDVRKPEWQEGWASAWFRDFGYYQLVVDQTPPVILPSGFADGANLSKASRIVFSVTDNLGRLRNVQTLLDGQWLRFTNDKGRSFIYRFDEHCAAGAHELTIIAEDEAGNTTTKTYRFTR